MTAQENKATFSRFMKELRKGNLAIVDEVCSPNFQFHSPNFPNWPGGLEGARTLATEGGRLIANGETTLDDFFATEDRVVVRMTIRGTYVGDKSVPGFPKKGERFAMGGVAIYRMVDGKIVDDWGIQLACPTDTPWG
jgi:ketosteroid isomerase-like protein